MPSTALKSHTEALSKDNKVVNAGIRRAIRPFLSEHGFGTFAPRYCWRHREETIDAIHFWSPYNWVRADLKGITTFSCQVDLCMY